MKTYKAMRRQTEQTLASRTGRPIGQNVGGLDRRFESKEEELDYEKIVREYYALLARAKAKLG